LQLNSPRTPTLSKFGRRILRGNRREKEILVMSSHILHIGVMLNTKNTVHTMHFHGGLLVSNLPMDSACVYESSMKNICAWKHVLCMGFAVDEEV
jgi:hypothetical protein